MKITDFIESFVEELEIEESEVTTDTNIKDLDEWDSLNHIHLVVAIEKKLKLRFTANEIQSWANVGEMMNDIMKKRG